MLCIFIGSAVFCSEQTFYPNKTEEMKCNAATCYIKYLYFDNISEFAALTSGCATSFCLPYNSSHEIKFCCQSNDTQACNTRERYDPIVKNSTYKLILRPSSTQPYVIPSETATPTHHIIPWSNITESTTPTHHRISNIGELCNNSTSAGYAFIDFRNLCCPFTVC